jgi:polysaccharide pyruvyl transferase WcaK-like protein
MGAQATEPGMGGKHLEGTGIRLLVIGAGFDNKGAEAMLLALNAFLRRRFPGCEVAHHADSPAWVPRLEEAGITALPPWPYVSRKIRIPEFWKDVLRLPLAGRHGLTDACYRGIKAALDISGFKSSDEFGAGEGRWWEIHQLKVLGVPVICMPQAWGPFERSAVRRYTRILLRGSPLVFARDAESMAHLQTLNALPPQALRMGADVALQFDPAGPGRGDSLLAEAGVERDGRPLVGVAPNVRVYERTSGEGPDNAYVRFLADACRRLLDEGDAQIILVPHEVGQAGALDDLGVARHLCSTAGLEGRMKGVWRDCPAADLKALIGRLDYLVASRFHTLVAALSMRTPALAIGWSHKYAELMAEAGTGRYSIGVDGLTGSGVDLLVEGFKRRGELAETLRAGVPAMEESSRRALDMAADLVERL